MEFKPPQNNNQIRSVPIGANELLLDYCISLLQFYQCILGGLFKFRNVCKFSFIIQQFRNLNAPSIRRNRIIMPNAMMISMISIQWRMYSISLNEIKIFKRNVLQNPVSDDRMTECDEHKGIEPIALINKRIKNSRCNAQLNSFNVIYIL